MAGQHRRIRHFAVGPVYLNKSRKMCSSDFVFRKYKQDSALRVNGVLQLAKTAPPVTKNFPLPSLIPLRCYNGLKVLHTLRRQMS